MTNFVFLGMFIEGMKLILPTTQCFTKWKLLECFKTNRVKKLSYRTFSRIWKVWLSTYLVKLRKDGLMLFSRLPSLVQNWKYILKGSGLKCQDVGLYIIRYKNIFQVLSNANRVDKGWAAGLGLERFAMLLFNIPDIRLFWSQDQRFLEQFQDGLIKDFQPFSKYPSCYKDLSFFVPENFESNGKIITQIYLSA